MEVKLNKNKIFEIISIRNSYYKDLFLLKTDSVNLIINLDIYNMLTFLKKKEKM